MQKKAGVEMVVASLVACWSWAACQLAEKIAKGTLTSWTVKNGKSPASSQPAAITHCPLA